MTTSGELKFGRFPQHIAIIMDGNRRWAELHGLSPLEGHRAGVDSLRTAVKTLANYQLSYLTVYVFSTENWNRSQDEVKGLFMLLEEMFKNKFDEMQANGIKLQHFGRLDELPINIQEMINKSVDLTRDNKNITLNIALNYGGRAEILNAIRGMISDHVSPETINETTIGRYLYTRGIPDVDLLIRSGGETRLSNFLIWQTVYSEIYFTDVLWPDFNEKEIDKALHFYSMKQRRFGGD
jgi:undecaprenyl diphosphate synthase